MKKNRAGGEPEGSENYQLYGKQDFERMESLSKRAIDRAFQNVETKDK
jgi:hypothetical protein